MFPPKDAESKIQEWTRCSKTMSSVVSSAGIYFYMFTKNLKTRLKRTRRICLSFTKFKQMIFDNAPPRSINRCDWVIAIEHRIKPEKQLFHTDDLKSAQNLVRKSDWSTWLFKNCFTYIVNERQTKDKGQMWVQSMYSQTFRKRPPKMQRLSGSLPRCPGTSA